MRHTFASLFKNLDHSAFFPMPSIVFSFLQRHADNPAGVPDSSFHGDHSQDHRAQILAARHNNGFTPIFLCLHHGVFGMCGHLAIRCIRTKSLLSWESILP
jgi:hypothetical protein